ncbi:MAG TPA: protein kinase, partial [Myxococcaceae bacterium]
EKTSPTAHELAVVGEKAAAALAHAHALGIFHRDIKPENLMVRSSDGEPVLVDFGAAAFPLGPTLTDQRLPPGTPRYNTPEAHRFDREHRGQPDARYEFKASDDIYALGVTLYDVLTVPRLHSNPQYLPVGSEFIPPMPAHRVNERVPVALSQLVEQMMARQPEQRPVSMEKVRRSLAEFPPLEGEEWKQRTLHPPSAQAPSPVPVPPRRAAPRRRLAQLAQLPRARTVAGAAGGLLVLLLLSLGVLRQDKPGPAPPPAPVAAGPQTLPGASPPPPAISPPEPAPAGTETSSPPAAPSAKKGNSMTASAPLSTPAEALCQRKKAPPRGSKEFREWCKCAALAGTLAAANAGCTAVPLRPDPGPCPPEAIEAMEDYVFYPEHSPKLIISLDKETPLGWPDEPKFDAWKEGPVTAKVIFYPGKNNARIPVGSLLFGYLWLDTSWGPQYAMLRFNRVETPEGKSYPVCIAGYEGDGLITKREGSRPGAAILPRYGHVYPAWENWPPPPGPYKNEKDGIDGE